MFECTVNNDKQSVQASNDVRHLLQTDAAETKGEKRHNALSLLLDYWKVHKIY